MGAVEESFHLGRCVIISLHEVVETFFVEGSNGLSQVSERIWVIQIKILTFIVTQNPGHDWVLGQI